MDTANATVIAHPNAEKRAAVVPAKPPFLLSPTLDVLMIGGASLVMAAVAWLFVDKGANTSQISWAAFYLAFVINNPHFMASYVLLYWDKRQELFKKPSFLWAAVGAPVLIAGWLVAGIAMQNKELLGYAVNFMFFTVGWHYIKQIYGTIVVTNARRGYFFTKLEGRLLKANLFPVWFMSYINGNGSSREVMQYGIGYRTFAIPDWARDLNFALLGISIAVVAGVVLRKWTKTGKLPGPASMVSFAAIYIWYLPSLYHAHFWYMIPFFHSLQYMLFVATIKKNQYAAEAKEASGGNLERERIAFLKKYLGFGAVIGATALLTFKLIPNWLDRAAPYDQKLFGAELGMFCFITFINIHHYFIDNVIWRRDNEMLKKYL